MTIRRFLKPSLLPLPEAAKTLDDAVSNDVMATVLDIFNSTSIILFSAKTLTQFFEEWSIKNQIPSDQIRHLPYGACILGGIRFIFENDIGIHPGHVIDYSYAEQKYGPLLYELAMAKIYPDILIPSTLIKPGAVKVWRKMLQRPDVEKVWILRNLLRFPGSDHVDPEAERLEPEFAEVKYKLEQLVGDKRTPITKASVEQAVKYLTPDEQETLTHMYGYRKNNKALYEGMVELGESFIKSKCRLHGIVNPGQIKGLLEYAANKKFHEAYSDS
jgi:hypothetical protein